MPERDDNPPQRKGEPPANQNKPEEFQRFEELTRKLAKVPKSELDEKRKTAALRRGRSTARK